MNKFIVLPYERFQALIKIPPNNKTELVHDKEAFDKRPQLVDQIGLGTDPPPPPPPQYRHLIKKTKRLREKPKHNWVIF
jgi:hypothetical protein